MKKVSSFIKRYIVFVIMCFIPFFVEAACSGTLCEMSQDFDRPIGFGSEAGYAYPHDKWSNVSCSGSTDAYWSYRVFDNGGYTYVYVKNKNNTVDTKYISLVCTSVNIGTESGTYHGNYKHTFNFTLSPKDTPTVHSVSYDMFKGDTKNLKGLLGIKELRSITHSTGSGYGTIGISGCAAGTGACSLTFSSGTPSQSRHHQFVVVYVGNDNVLYKTTVNVYEMDTVKTFGLGTIDPGATKYGEYIDGVTNFSCTNSSSGVPVTVTRDGSGNRYRIKVTSTNNTTNAYNGKQAVCTFTKNSRTYTYKYNYNLKAQTPEEVTKNYDAYPNDVINVYRDLNVGSIISLSGNYNTNVLTYSGCSSSDSSCSITMKSNLTPGRTTRFTMLYYDRANKLKRATINITEKTNTVSNDLGMIGVGVTKTVSIPASGVTCAAADSTKPYEVNVTKVNNTSYKVSIKNVNTTVNTYNNISYSCTGVPDGVGGRQFTYAFKFGLSPETVPIKDEKSYELFPTESIDFEDLYAIKQSRPYNYVNGSQYNTLSIFGCQNTQTCKISFIGNSALQNRKHTIVLTYVNANDVLYETTVYIYEKDPSITTKAYPGLLGFCEFNSDWELSRWADSSGKNYSYYEAKTRNAVLPDCKVDPTNNTERLPLTFKGWTKGYQAGDTLTTKTSCGTNLTLAGQPSSSGQTYAPCYEMTPHIRVSTNSGTLKNADGFEFRASDMTYIKFGSSFTQTVKLPDVEYTGFHSSSSLQAWKNSATGETKRPGDSVPLDGSVWVAVSNRTVTQVDLYKTIGLNEVDLFTVSGMTSCSLDSGSSYLSATYKYGDCEVKGLAVTPFDVYADVVVTLNDGSVRVYKFNVEDRSKINEDDNGIFNVDIEDNVEIGKNDESTLNDFNTDQCEDFFISRNGYVKYTFAKAKPSHGYGAIDMNTGIYSVYQLCPTDYSTYVGLCLDPGRRGPNESGTGTHTKTFTFKGETKTVNGNEYRKTDDIQRNGEFGKLVMYIVKNLDISKFDDNSGNALVERAAAHVAVRSMAIHTGFSSTPDPGDEVYASHYYPYLGVSKVIADGLTDGDISQSEATKAVDDGKDGEGFQNWVPGVRSLVIDILANYGGSDSSQVDDGFTRTIDDTIYQPSGNGYTINYKGTITAPTGATANMTACRNASPYGAQCVVNSWTLASDSGGRKTYNYDVTVTIANAGSVKPPTTVDEEKDLSFQIEYSGGHDLVNAFIASPKNGSDNVQRMLIISTSNPKVYIYFSVVPNNCDLPVLDASKCPDETTCIANKNNKTFNAELFKAAGCCRYQLNENSYVFKAICSAECTSSTLTSVCEYVANGKEKADFYEIKEGSQYKGDVDGYQDSIGTCIVNVSDYYKNDNATPLGNFDTSKKFTKYDDVENLINVDSYNDNRYCQVTCKEDWELSMDSFGNFIGADAVAAGTYFQIVSNDMFMGAKRTCYTTFINYDRFMANVVDLSNELVKAYNRYSKWSHVWTDIDRQVDKGYQSVKSGYYTSTQQSAVCVEYFDKCPQKTSSSYDNYYWSDEVNNCRRVPHYGSSSGYGGSPSCQSKPTDNQGDDYSDGTVTYTNSGANDDSTQCTFIRTYCDGNHNEKASDSEELVNSNTQCKYKTYKTRSTTSKVYTYKSRPTKTCAEGVTGPCYDSCGTGWSVYGTTQCRKKVCPSGYTDVDGTCYYNTCPTTHPYSYDSTECYKYAYTGTHTARLYMDPAYDTETLKCKVYGKGYDFTLKTENEVEEVNSDGKDIYYNTKEYDKKASEGYDDRDSIADKGDNNRQNKTEDGSNVKGNYSKLYKHDCTLTPAPYKPYDGTTATQGSSKCVQTSLSGEQFTPSTYEKVNEMFCKDNGYAVLSGTERKNAFCKVNDNHNDNNTNATQTYASTDYAEKEDAFEWITTNFLEHAKKELDDARSTMTSYHSQIYSHAQDIFDCQNFQLHNRTDDNTAGRANNTTPTDTIMGMNRSYVNINTDYDPTAAYTYDESFFMERVDKDNVLIQYTEKNDAVYGGTGNYASATNTKKPATITTPGGTVNTMLYRNYIENAYYNPIYPWATSAQAGDASDAVAMERVNKYHDNRSQYVVSSPQKAAKKIVLCTVGVISNGTGYKEGKDGEYVAFTSTSSTPEWLGGRCYQVTVDYKKVHYVKSSLSNSSYYKNKGYWYVRGGDSKIHGDDISGAISKFNRIQPSGYEKAYNNNAEEHKRWSRLGSFNVFPISMATPRNLYQYTYTFGQIGSYYNGDLGRIMGTEKSIIQNNKRTCFYEVFEEVCLCCGYKVEPGDLVEQVAGGHGGYTYEMSDPSKAGGNTNGNITFYTNSVALGDIDLGRDSNTLGTNWSANAPFMYNGDNNLTTDKGHKLKENIEATGENIYAREPEYAYYLTPDSLKQIRSYNDANGYDLNLDKLIVYDVSKIECDGSNCKEGNTETINFQHYGSKFLIGDVDGAIELNSYGTIQNSYRNVCIVKDTDYSATFDMESKMKNGGCRWVDFVETNQTYYNPTTKSSSNTWFRLSFK